MSILPCCMGDNMVTVYDGWRCLVCETVYPCGCEPWGETVGGTEDEEDTP